MLASCLTSAAVDAYCAGLRVISVLDPTALNLSPLRGFDEVRYVSSGQQFRRLYLKNLGNVLGLEKIMIISTSIVVTALAGTDFKPPQS